MTNDPSTPSERNAGNEDPIVVCRYRNTALGLSPSVPFSRLYESLNRSLSVDKVYFVLAGPEGAPTLKEAGQVVLTFVPYSETVQPPRSPSPWPELDDEGPLVATPIQKGQDAPGQPEAPKPIPTPSPKKKRATKRQPRPLPGKGEIKTDGFIVATEKDSDDCDMFGKIRP